MRAISIKCPECAAKMEAVPDAETATCSYCGKTSYIRRRSRFLEIPQPPPRQPAGRPAFKVATQQHSGRWVGGVIVAVALCGLAVPCAMKAKKMTGINLGGPSSLREPRWEGVDGVMLADLTGDGILDVIGRMRILQPDDVTLWAAFDSATGKRLWLSPVLGDRGKMLHAPSGLAHGVVITGLGPGELAGLSAKDGSVKWRIRLSEKIKAICDGDREGTVLVETADDRMSRISAADGVIDQVLSPGPCHPLPTDRSSTDSPSWQAIGHRGPFELPREFEGMRVREGVRDPQSGVAIAIGTKHPGSDVGMVARFEPDSGARVWTAVVPASDPLSARPGPPDDEDVAVSGETVAIAYNVKFAHGYRLTAFAADDGRRLWDVALPGDSPMSAVRLSPSHVFVSRWDGLYAFDRASGRRAFTVD